MDVLLGTAASHGGRLPFLDRLNPVGCATGGARLALRRVHTVHVARIGSWLSRGEPMTL